MLSDDKYTPSMDELRDAFAGKGKGYANEAHYERQGAEFDRALQAHDRQVATKELTDAAEHITNDYLKRALLARAAALGGGE